MKQYKTNFIIPIITGLLFYCAGFTVNNIFISISLLVTAFILTIFNNKQCINIIENYENTVEFLEEKIPVIGSGRIDWEEYLDVKNDIPKSLKPGEIPKFNRNNIVYQPKKPL